MSSTICHTEYYPNLVAGDTASEIYEYLKNNIEWEDGIKTKRSGFTRLAKSLNLEDDSVINTLVRVTIQKMAETSKNPIKHMLIFGCYLNYYQHGEHYTPNHKHDGTQQIIISLGATRTLVVANKSYEMKNGDTIIFGSSLHGVPKDINVKEGRISIALFCKFL